MNLNDFIPSTPSFSTLSFPYLFWVTVYNSIVVVNGFGNYSILNKTQLNVKLSICFLFLCVIVAFQSTFIKLQHYLCIDMQLKLNLYLNYFWQNSEIDLLNCNFMHCLKILN